MSRAHPSAIGCASQFPIRRTISHQLQLMAAASNPSADKPPLPRSNPPSPPQFPPQRPDPRRRQYLPVVLVSRPSLTSSSPPPDCRSRSSSTAPVWPEPCPCPPAKTTSSPVVSRIALRKVSFNPRSDRRTTKGIFHIVEGGLPIPARIAIQGYLRKILRTHLIRPRPTPAFTASQPDGRVYSSLCSCVQSSVPPPRLTPREPWKRASSPRPASSAISISSKPSSATPGHFPAPQKTTLCSPDTPCRPPCADESRSSRIPSKASDEISRCALRRRHRPPAPRRHR